MSKLNVIRSLSAALTIAASTCSGIASAQSNPTICDGGVPWVDFDYASGGRLTMGCVSGGVTYVFYAMVNAGTCTDLNVPMEVLKVWKATADEALLSGKRVHIYWSSCSDSLPRVTTMSLRR